MSGNRNTIIPKTLDKRGNQMRDIEKILVSNEDPKGEVKWLQKMAKKPQDQETPAAQESAVIKESPAKKYWTCFRFNQAGTGWIGFESKAGLRTVFIKSGLKERRNHNRAPEPQIQKTGHTNMVNLMEAFDFKQMVWFVYEFDPFDTPLSVLCATPNIKISEAEIATICREILKGLQYIHEQLRLSHGSVHRKNILLSHSGTVKIGEKISQLALFCF
jgi:serine/threonine protein kinase